MTNLMYVNCYLILKNQMQKERKCWLRYSREPSKDECLSPHLKGGKGSPRKELKIQADRSMPRSPHIDYSPHQPSESGFDPLRLRHTPRGPVIQGPPFPTLPVPTLPWRVCHPPSQAHSDATAFGTVSSETVVWITNGSLGHRADFYLVINLLKH